MRATFSRFAERRWLAVLPILIGLLAAMLPASAALAQQAPPGAAPKYLSRFQVGGAPAQFDLVQVGFDFAPKAWTPDYTNGGTTYNTVMAGEITLRVNGAEKVYKAGDTWSGPAGQVHAAGNNGQGDAIVFTSVILPTGASLTTTQGGTASQGLPPGPKALFLNRFPVTSAPSPLDLVQAELDQAPGSWTAMHTHPGPVFNTVVAGKLMVRADGKDTTYGPGQSWVNPQGQVHAVQNAGSAPSAGFTTFLVPRGAGQLSTQVAPPPTSVPSAEPTPPPPQTLPVTGKNGSQADAMWPGALALAVVLAGAGLLAVRGKKRAA